MSDVLPLLIVGMTTGSVYAIAAIGLVLTYKTSGVFNFAHGAQAAVGAYLMYSLRDQQGVPWPIAALVAVLIAGVLGGILLERLAQRLSAVSTAWRVAATVGLLVGIQGFLILVYGASAIPFDQFLPDRLIRLPAVNIRMSQLIVMLLAIAAAGGLYAFFQRSRLGISMQAVVDDADLLGLQGINPHAVRRYAWIVGSVFAAISGILLAPTLGLDATLLTLLVVQAFGAAAIGAFNSLLGTYVGAIGIGVAVAILPGYLGPLSNLAGQSTFPFLVLFVALLVTPAGRLVQRGTHIVQQRSPKPLPRVVGATAVAAGGGLLLAVPTFVGTNIGLYTEALVFVILFSSLGLLVRTSGQVSLCHMAFAAVGAAIFARAATAGFPWPVAVLVGGLAAVPVGAAVAIPAIRLSGVYLAIATFGFGLLMERIFYNSFLMFGALGSLKAPRPGLTLLPFESDVGYYYLVLAVAVLCVGMVLKIRGSRLGRLLRGLADSPTALAAHGTNTNLTRTFVFIVSAFLAGIAGAVMGPITGSATALSFDFFTSLLLVAVLAIAGRRPALSPFVAAVAFSVIPNEIGNQALTEVFPILFGAATILVAVTASKPKGSGNFWMTKRTRERAASTARRRAVVVGEGAAS